MEMGVTRYACHAGHNNKGGFEMKKIGTSIDGGVMLEIGQADLIELKHIVRNRLVQFVDILFEGLCEAAGITVAKPNSTKATATAAAAPDTSKPRRAEAVQDRKPAAIRPVGGEIYHRCEQCDELLPADAAPQRRYCAKCVQDRKNACPSMQKLKAKTAAPDGTMAREATCDTCHKRFPARVFGPVPHHCPACRPGAKTTAAPHPPSPEGFGATRAPALPKGTAAARAPAIQNSTAVAKPVAAHRPPMPSDDAGKAARLEAIRRVALREARELEADVIAGATEN